MTNQVSALLAASSRVAFAAYLPGLAALAARAGLGKPADCFRLVQEAAPQLYKGDLSPFVSDQAQPAEPVHPTNTPAPSTPDAFVSMLEAKATPESWLQSILATAAQLSSAKQAAANPKNASPSKPAKGQMAQPETAPSSRVRQFTLLEQVALEAHPKAPAGGEPKWRYPLQALAPKSIFPQLGAKCEPVRDDLARSEYRALWDQFLQALQSIDSAQRSQWPLWLDHFDTAWLNFAQAVPADSVTTGRPDVSMYDHCKTTAALATALWRWHQEQQQTDVQAQQRLQQRQDWDQTKFLLIQGDFFGIQDFVFGEGSQSNRHAAKLLRGRSFQVSLFTELAALRLLEALELPPTSQITNAAGKFLVLAPNTESVRQRLEQVRLELNQWFLRYGHGQIGLGLVAQAASCNDLQRGRIRDLMRLLFAQLEQAKLHRFDLMSDSPAALSVQYPLGVCCYNHRLAADQPQGQGLASAALSRDQIKLGSELTRKDLLLVWRDTQQALPDAGLVSLETPIFGYRVGFSERIAPTSSQRNSANSGLLLRCWDFSLPENLDDTLWRGYARRYVNAYVPRLSELDQQTEGKYRGLDEPTDWGGLRYGLGKTLNHLACEDRSCDASGGHWFGQVALTTLKGDVDNLGLIFQQGLPDPSLSKMAALSRQMNAFFAIWLPAVCATEFPNTYTVFAGGDDFFLIGPWLSTQKLAERMATAFEDYVAHNPAITFSAGMVMSKPGLPIRALAQQAEQALDAAKASHHPQPQQRKNALVLFGERVRWSEWPKLRAAQEQLEQVRHDYQLSTGYVYGLLQLVQLAADSANPEHSLWRSRFAYRTRRYAVDRLPQEQRLAAQKTLATAIGRDGIEALGSRYRIALFNHFYRLREG